MNTTPLAAKVEAQNRANALAIELAPKLQAALQTWIGRKVCNANNILAKKADEMLRAVIPTLTNDSHCYLRGGHSVWLEIKTQAQYQEPDRDYTGTKYATAAVNLGDVEYSTGTLKAVYPFEPHQYRANWTESEIIELRKVRQSYELAMRKADSDLGDFGLYDQ